MKALATLATAACAGVFACALSGCDSARRDTGADEMHWARSALDRNPELKVLAEDDAGRVFTVQLASSGDVRIVTLAQLVAGPSPLAADAAGAAPPDAPPPDTPPAGRGRPVPGPDSTPTDNTPVAPSAADPDPAPPVPPPARGSRVLASGPGYSIAASGPSGRTANPAPERASGSRAAPAQNTVAQMRSEPIICQGNRRLRIDGQNLEFSGDAITAESGCDLHITNSRIHAAGIAVSARASNVHIENSIVEGTDSVDASDGSQIYLQASSFKGLSRRLDTAQLHDLGGNVWN